MLSKVNPSLRESPLCRLSQKKKCSSWHTNPTVVLWRNFMSSQVLNCFSVGKETVPHKIRSIFIPSVLWYILLFSSSLLSTLCHLAWAGLCLLFNVMAISACFVGVCVYLKHSAALLTFRGSRIAKISSLLNRF